MGLEPAQIITTAVYGGTLVAVEGAGGPGTPVTPVRPFRRLRKRLTAA